MAVSSAADLDRIRLDSEWRASHPEEAARCAGAQADPVGQSWGGGEQRLFWDMSDAAEGARPQREGVREREEEDLLLHCYHRRFHHVVTERRYLNTSIYFFIN